MQVVTFLENCMQIFSVFIHTHVISRHFSWSEIGIFNIWMIFQWVLSKTHVTLWIPTLWSKFHHQHYQQEGPTITCVSTHKYQHTETPENIFAYYIGPCCDTGFYSSHTSPTENSIWIHRYLYMKNLFRQGFQQVARNRHFYGNVPVSPC